MGDPGQGVGAPLQGHPQGQGRAQHIQGIIYHKSARDANFDGRPPVFRHRVEGDVVRRQGDVLRPQVRVRALRVEVPPAGGVPQQPLRPGVVGVADAHLAVLEQDGLGVAVGLHGLVEVQVVLGEIGEDAHGEADAVHPLQKQGVGGGLHHHVGAAGGAHPGEQLLELQGLRRGALRGDRLAADHVLVGADEAHLGPRLLLQDGLQQIGGGGLAVGAGDGHHGHVVRRMAVPVGGHHRQGLAGVRHLDIGDGGILRRPLAHHRRGARRRGPADIGVTVGGKAGHGHEHVPGRRGPGVIADMGDLRLRVRRGGQRRQPCQKILQFHHTNAPSFSLAWNIPPLL